MRPATRRGHDALPQRPHPDRQHDPHGFLIDPRITGRQFGQSRSQRSSPRAVPRSSTPTAGPRCSRCRSPTRRRSSASTSARRPRPASRRPRMPPPRPARARAASPARPHAHRAPASPLRRPAREGAACGFAFRRRVASRATVEVFQASVGRRIVGNRRIARFTGRRRSFTWSGKRARDGVLFARFRVRVAKGVSDVRRVTLRRSHGRFRLGRSSLPPPRLRAADPVQARLAGLRRRGQPLRADRVPARLAGARDRARAARRPRRAHVQGAPPPGAPHHPAARGLATARARRPPLPDQRPPRRAHGDGDARRPPFVRG